MRKMPKIKKEAPSNACLLHTGSKLSKSYQLRFSRFWKGEDRHQLNAKTMGRNTKKLATRSLPSGKRINNQFETDGIHRCPELRAKEKSAPSDNKIANVLVI